MPIITHSMWDEISGIGSEGGDGDGGDKDDGGSGDGSSGGKDDGGAGDGSAGDGGVGGKDDGSGVGDAGFTIVVKLAIGLQSLASGAMALTRQKYVVP